MWVRPIFTERDNLGEYNLVEEMADHDPESFRKYFRMDRFAFMELLNMIQPKISKLDTNWRKAIPAAVRLAITLRYGNEF